MTDYAELVKKLRNRRVCVQSGGSLGEDFPLMKEAADAIEELSKKYIASEVDNTNLTGWLAEEHANQCPHYIRNMHDRGDDSLCEKYHCEVKALPRWIPVTERLPENGVHVLLSCKCVVGTYVCDGFHTEKYSTPVYIHDDIYADYDEEADEYYFPEGWWEVIKNWDEYSSVAIEDTVTHWMPLPPPPKGEE